MSPTGKPRVKKERPPPTPKRKHAWDMPAFPLAGDTHDTDTFTAIGRALSQWEYLEAYLGLTYGHFVGSDTPTSPAMRAYGAVSAFSTRYDMVKVATEAYFLQTPHEIHSTFIKIIDEAKEFSTRRNEIAHGIVQPYSYDQRILGYALGPSRHATRKHKLYLEIDFNSSNPIGYISEQMYAYTSIDIDYFRMQFERLGKALEEIYLHLYTIRMIGRPPEGS